MDYLAERATDNPLVKMLRSQVDLSALKMSEIDDLYKFFDDRTKIL